MRAAFTPRGRATKRPASLPAALMLVPVIVAATTDGKRYQQAARDGDADNAREQQREHDAPESSSHVQPSLCCLTRAPPGVFAPEKRATLGAWLALILRGMF